MTRPLLMLPGWGLHAGIWQATVAGLSGHDCRPCNLPGYAGIPACRPYTPFSLAAAVAEQAPKRCVALGWSMGGMVAMAWAAARPEQVRALILVASTPVFVNRPDWPHGLAPEVLAEFARSLSTDYRATLLRFLALQARGGEAAREVIAELRQTVFAEGEPDPAVLAAGLDLLREVDLRAQLAQITCPTLIVHGGYDGLCPPAAAEWLAGQWPNARLALQPRAAHAPFLSHPDWFNTTVQGFLDALD